MKKVLKLVAILFSTFLIVGCSKPKITKEQQDNIAIRGFICVGHMLKAKNHEIAARQYGYSNL